MYGATSRIVLMDTSAQLVIMSTQFVASVGLTDDTLCSTKWKICTVGGMVKLVLGETPELVTITFNVGIAHIMHLALRYLITCDSIYTLLLK